MTVWDKLLIVTVLATTLASVSFVRGAVGGAVDDTDVIVKVDGKVASRLPLDRDRVVPITSGHGTCLLEIKAGRARIAEADCPKKLCMAQGAIGPTGGIIVCLPHKVVVSVENKAGPGDTIDALVR